jgi:hypothetical protein
MANETMTLQKRAHRADEIVAARARGECWATIAASHGVSARQAQRIYAAGCATPPALERDPVELACEVLAEYDEAIDELRRLTS